MLPIILLLALPYTIYLVYVIVLTLVTIARGEKKCKTLFANGILLISEIVFTIIGPAIGFSRFDQFQPDIPFSKHHVLSIIILVIVSSACFWLAKLTSKTGNPFIRIIASVGMLQGIILCLVTSIHFIKFFALGIIYPFAGFELLSPLIALFLLSREFYFYNRLQPDLDLLLPYRQQLGFVPLTHKIMQSPLGTKMLIYSAMLVTLLIPEILCGYTFGQDVDSILKAFTASSGFTFSHSIY